jgi:hypothetical protein
MKKYLLIILTLIPLFLFSYIIEETLSQIESLKNELSHNEQIVEEKISNLKKSNPLFADQDPFESSVEYAERLKKGQPVIENIKKQYLGNLKQKLSQLRNRLFETEYVSVELGKYNADKELYSMKVKHLYWQKEVYNFGLPIGREDAKTLYKNWDKVKKTGIRTIDIGDKVGLSKIQLFEPISGLNITQELQPMMILDSDIYEATSFTINNVTFSPDGMLIAMFDGWNGFSIFDSKNGNRLFVIKHDDFYKAQKLMFDKSSSYVIGIDTDFGIDYPCGINIADLKTKKIVRDFKNIGFDFFRNDGEFLFTLDKQRRISADGKYDLKIEGTVADIHRIFTQTLDEVYADKVISYPPSLSASVSFSETSGNQYLDALEKGEIVVTVTNYGEGSGKGLTIKFEPERIEGLNYNNAYIEEIPAGETVTVKIPIEAYIDVVETDHLLRINFDEINVFPPTPVEIGFSTKAYLKPVMFIIDVGIEDNNKNGMIESGETTKLTVRIGNKGKGIATGAYAKFYSEDNVFITDSYPKVVNLGDLEYNQHIDIPLEFFVNDKAADEIPLYVDLTEATGISGVDHLRIPILKSERTREIKRTVVAGIDKNYGDLDFENDLSIDIEQNIPVAKKSNKKALAIIFGIENYRNVSNVNYAFRDATIMKEYFSKTLGIPEEQIYFRENDEVTLGEFRKIFSKNGWLDKRVIENETDIYFYYAGHGAPAIKEEKAFLIPFDGDPNYPVQTGYSLETVFENLSKLNANSVTVFLDACFTGANRENEMLLAGARPVSIQLKNNYVNNVTVFSATSSNEISSSYPKNKHGLFSYFLMKGMQSEADTNKDNKLTINELFDYTKKNVSRIAGTLNREQTPQLECLEPEKIIINY